MLSYLELAYGANKKFDQHFRLLALHLTGKLQ